MGTIKSELKRANNVLGIKGVDAPFLDAEVILAFILGKTREYLHTYPEKKVGAMARLRYRRLLAKRMNNIPLAYIIGKKDFAGLEFGVGPGVLVPRPETEKMVELARGEIKEAESNNKNVIDVGTGSGCIAITLARQARKEGIRANFLAFDISRKALKRAIVNAREHRVKEDIEFARSDLLSYFLKNRSRLAELNIITANLPYLSGEEYKRESSIKKEPREALVAGEEGLKYYRKLFEQIKKFGPTGLKSIIFCEISPHQAEGINSLSTNILDRRAKIHNDITGRARVAEIRIEDQ